MQDKLFEFISKYISLTEEEKNALLSLNLFHSVKKGTILLNDNGNKIKDGFQIFNSYRFGYHIKLFKDKFFFQPSICMTHRAFHTELPDGFKQLDDKWSKFVFPEPGLNIGFNF